MIFSILASYFPFLYLFADKTAEQCGSTKLFGIIPSWFQYLNFDDDCAIKVDLAKHPEELYKILLAIVEILLRLGGIVAFAFIIYGGFKFVTSQGDPEGVKDARTTVINALVGVVITTLASTIVAYIAGKF